MLFHSFTCDDEMGDAFILSFFVLLNAALLDCRMYAPDRGLALFTRRTSLGLHPAAFHIKLGSLERIG